MKYMMVLIAMLMIGGCITPSITVQPSKYDIRQIGDTVIRINHDDGQCWFLIQPGVWVKIPEATMHN